MLLAGVAQAATGCSLRNPGADIRRFFPEYTDYVVHYVTFARQAPGALPDVEAALGGPLDPTFETPDVPYTLYRVRRAGETLGYVFGTNQRGRYSNLQVIAVTDDDLDLRSVYLQTLRSPQYEALQADGFLEALAAWPLDRYPSLSRCWVSGDCAGAPAADPTGGADVEDYRAILRALAKLSTLRTQLLHPGEARTVRDRTALAEWIGNHEAVVLPLAVNDTPRFGALAADPLPDDTPVVVVRHRGRTAVYPVTRLRPRPVVHEGGLVVAWSETSGTALAIETDVRLQPTADVLFDLRVLRDPATGETWAGPRSVSGQGTGRPVPAVVVPAGVARASVPFAAVLLGEAAPGPAVATAGARALVVGDAVGPGAWLTVEAGGRTWALDPGGRRLRQVGDRLRDDAGGEWTLLGRALSGPEAGTQLDWPPQADLPGNTARTLAPFLFTDLSGTKAGP